MHAPSLPAWTQSNCCARGWPCSSPISAPSSLNSAICSRQAMTQPYRFEDVMNPILATFGLRLCERSRDEKTVAERQWRKPKLAPKAQQPCDLGLFSDE